MNTALFLLLFRAGITEVIDVTEVNAILSGPTSQRMELRGGYQRTLELSGPTSEVITVEG